jgi:hypothetical protein
MSNQDIQSKQDIKINKLEAKADTLQNQINILIFQSAAAIAKNEIVEKLNKIPQ